MKFLKYAALAIGAFILVVMAKDLYSKATYDVNEHAAALTKQAIDNAILTRKTALLMEVEQCKMITQARQKNPSKFEFVDYDFDGANVIVNYYGQNSYGAMILSQSKCAV